MEHKFDFRSLSALYKSTALEMFFVLQHSFKAFLDRDRLANTYLSISFTILFIKNFKFIFFNVFKKL